MGCTCLGKGTLDMKVKIAEARRLLEEILTKKGLSLADAQIVADEYLSGELQKKTSHGLMAFPSLVEKLGKRKPKPSVLKKTNSMVLIDARENEGAVVGREGADMAIEMAKKEGIGVAFIKNMVTWLRPGTLSKYVADKGYIGIVINNGGKPMVAPPGGYEPVIGTNPIGIGVPTSDDPIVADMATSIRAWGEVRKATAAGTNLPKDSYYDKKGNFAVKPEDAYSALPAGGYKGFALGLLIEVLTGSFLGREMGSQQMTNDYRTMTRGGMILVLNPNISTSLSNFKKQNSELVRNIKNTQKLKGVDEIMMPGEKSDKQKKENLKKGILEINDELWSSLIEASRSK